MKTKQISVSLATISIAVVLLTLPVSCGRCGKADTVKLTDYVDQYIGTGDHGHVFMGANVPFGFVQLGPTSIPEVWDWTSGYHITDTTVIGFAHTHLSGTGIGDLSDISLMPVTGQVTLARGSHDDLQSGQWSYFSRASEKAHPGYYATRLDRYGIDVELTATKRVGFHKYTFPENGDSRIIIDLENGHCWDRPTDCYLVQESDTTVSGYRYSTGWADDQKIYFTAVFSRPMEGFIVSEKNDIRPGTELRGERIYGQALFATSQGEDIFVKVALSPVSIENAKMNLAGELPGWDFEGTISAADRAWERELSKIRIETGDESIKRIFYTSMYHSMIAPSEFCDVNGDYRGADGKIYRDADFVNYTTFSLWDTYRAAHPLMTIIHPEKVDDIINTMLKIYEQQDKLPVWHLMGCETNCMVGNPAIPVVADAILKGYDGFDKALAYEAMRRSATLDERGLKELKEYGYIPYAKMVEAVGNCMEYAIADWALAQAALEIGDRETADYFLERSKSYRYYFDPETGFIRGKSSTGDFRTPFDPFESVHYVSDYTEGNGWQYTFLVPHDLEGLVGLFGSSERFIEKLDSLFIAEGDLGEHASPDISGLIGQYAHGNEPSHHVIYFYTMIGEPWKAAERARETMYVLYTDQPEGLCGNEDVGQISSWYILSSLGFYQVEPAGGRYYFGSPIVDRATVDVGGGRKFNITARNQSRENIYIEKITLDGKDYNKNYIDFSDIQAGGQLVYHMTSRPGIVWWDAD
ncbi:MAG: GH92 family glycosyl hydrolase [Rikenellaceae bacterium]|nr:GH92 family glycosyl hydrolase [Rikenellaceae bacterium]